MQEPYRICEMGGNEMDVPSLKCVNQTCYVVGGIKLPAAIIYTQRR